ENHSGGDARAHEACGQGAERRVHAGFFLCCVRRGAWCRVDGGCAGGDSCPPPPIPPKATMHTSEGKSNLTYLGAQRRYRPARAAAIDPRYGSAASTGPPPLRKSP